MSMSFTPYTTSRALSKRPTWRDKPSRKFQARSKYEPHQGKREMARRVRQSVKLRRAT
jgi:hypothetical protein